MGADLGRETGLAQRRRTALGGVAVAVGTERDGIGVRALVEDDEVVEAGRGDALREGLACARSAAGGNSTR